MNQLHSALALFLFFFFFKFHPFSLGVSVGQVRELEQILKSRNPNSIPALIYAVASADKQNEASRPGSINALLERRVQHLEAELESHEQEAKRSLQSMEQQFQRIKVTPSRLRGIFGRFSHVRLKRLRLFRCCTVFSSATSSRSLHWRNKWRRSSSHEWITAQQQLQPQPPGPRLSLWRSCSGKRKLTWRKRFPSRNRSSPSGCSSNKRFAP